MNNFFAAHADKAGLMVIGLCIAGFISDIQWQLFTRALGF